MRFYRGTDRALDEKIRDDPQGLDAPVEFVGVIGNRTAHCAGDDEKIVPSDGRRERYGAAKVINGGLSLMRHIR